MKTKKTRILCRQSHTFHTVTFHADGSVTSSGCENVERRAAVLNASARLGGTFPADVPDCVGLVGLVRHGIPHLLNTLPNGDGYIDQGAWRDLYTRFCNIKLVEATMAETRRKRDGAHKETLAAARTQLNSCKGYGRKFFGHMAEKTQFVQDRPMLDHGHVATSIEAIWTIPLQSSWLENVHKAGISVLDGRFVCGISENGRHVFVLHVEKGGSVTVRKREFVTKPVYSLGT